MQIFEDFIYIIPRTAQDWQMITLLFPLFLYKRFFSLEFYTFTLMFKYPIKYCEFLLYLKRRSMTELRVVTE